MILHCKIGTMPGGLYLIKNKKDLVVGDKVYFKEYPLKHGTRWEYGRVTEINMLLGTLYYFIERI